MTAPDFAHGSQPTGDLPPEEPCDEASEPARGGPDARFVEEFVRTQRRLYIFVLTQVGRPTDAEDILQGTNLIIWRKAAQFRPGTNFFAWAARIAEFEIRKHRERLARDRLRFSPEFLTAVARETEFTDDGEERRKALSICLEKLRPKDRELIRLRYAAGENGQPGDNGKAVAQALGRPTNAVYQSLGRIRRTLLECMQRQLALMGEA